jgi:hypothetical protein
MVPRDVRQRPDTDAEQPPVPCAACRAVFESPDRDAAAFLLVDQLTIPVVGCADHLDEFRAVCGHTTDGTADLLDHRPAGGIACPGCRLAPRSHEHPLIPVERGGVVVLACPTHRSQIVGRFRTGLETRRQITSPLDTS